MTVTVTGASGHVGNNLVRMLLAEGRHVRCLVREDSRALEGLDVERVRGDVVDQESLLVAFSGAEAVYHVAGRVSIVSGDEALVDQVNIEGTRNVVEACLKCEVKRLIHFSSVHVLEQNPQDEPLTEARSLVGDNAFPYVRSKSRGENEVVAGLRRGLNVTIVNPSGIIGPYDFKPSLTGDLLLRLSRGKMWALIEGGYNFVDVRDVALGAIAAEKKGRRGERYILSGEWVAVKDLASMWAEIAGVKVPRLICPLWLAEFAAPFSELYARLVCSRPLFTNESVKVISKGNRYVSHEKATVELGYDPRPIRSTLEDIHKWFVETRQL